jgi:hypothetical protein
MEKQDIYGATEGVRVGEMGRAGTEVTYEFSCYVEPDGKVVKSHKQVTPRASGINQRRGLNSPWYSKGNLPIRLEILRPPDRR